MSIIFDKTEAMNRRLYETSFNCPGCLVPSDYVPAWLSNEFILNKETAKRIEDQHKENIKQGKYTMLDDKKVKFFSSAFPYIGIGVVILMVIFLFV